MTGVKAFVGATLVGAVVILFLQSAAYSQDSDYDLPIEEFVDLPILDSLPIEESSVESTGEVKINISNLLEEGWEIVSADSQATGRFSPDNYTLLLRRRTEVVMCYVGHPNGKPVSSCKLLDN